MRLLLAARLPPLQRRAFSTPLDYDLLVIGGGSAGLACSKTASSLGARVALIDAVSPTPSGTSWGIGGTCANVGCIPKKLMHQAALVGAELKTAGAYGWQGVEEKVHCEWPVLRKVVQDRIKANNWIYRVQLNQKGIKYYNAFAEFVDGRTVKTTGVDRKQTEHLLSAPSIVVATGLRPRYPTIPGAHLGITSDDFFSLKDAPGKTLFVGGGYVSLECAGVLSGLGGQATAAVRSHWLRGFDRDCVSRVVSQMESHGVDLLEGAEPLCVEQTEQGRKRVTLAVKGEERVEEYDTVVWAIGREPRLSPLHLDTAGVSVSIDSGKILVDGSDATTAHGIYALGDVAEGRPELTPSAILAGQLLAKRLFGGIDRNMDYENIATTIFTPLEFSTLGLSEEAAEREYGEEGIEVYHSFFTPFEYVVPQNPQHCYSKVVCERDSGRVLGMHIVGPSAAEIIQGYAVAFKLGITFSDLSHTVAVHPCSAEQFVRVCVTKRSGDDPRPTGCCG